MRNNSTVTLNLSETEMKVLEDLSAKHDMSKTAVMRKALQLYQYVDQEARENNRKLLIDGVETLVVI